MRTTGSPFMKRCQEPPPSRETKKPNSVPTYSRLGLRGSWRIVLTLPNSGRFEEMLSQLRP